MKKILKNIRYFHETIIVILFLAIFRLIGHKNSIKLSVFLTTLVGKRLSVHKLARNNIKKALKISDNDKINDILDRMWCNLGKIIAEIPYLKKIEAKNIENIVKINKRTQENIKKLQDNKKGGIIFSAHIGNWEIGEKLFAKYNLKVHVIYRALNNRIIDQIILNNREGINMIVKSASGNKKIIDAIKKSEYVFIMADQKITDGIMVPFFGYDVLTTNSIAKLSLKYDIPIIPIRSIRKEDGFEVEIDDFMYPNKKDNIFSITKSINKKIEDWIKEYPEQWFWVHDRWKI